MNKFFRYIEKRNEQGVLIGIEEVKTSSSLEEIVKINKEIKKNNEQLEMQKNKEEAAKKAAFDLEEKQKEKETFCAKYSLNKFIVAATIPLMLGDFKDFDFVEKITKVDDKYEVAKLIKARLEKIDAIDVKKIYEKL